jgi:hypothetical protein
MATARNGLARDMAGRHWLARWVPRRCRRAGVGMSRCYGRAITRVAGADRRTVVGVTRLRRKAVIGMRAARWQPLIGMRAAGRKTLIRVTALTFAALPIGDVLFRSVFDEDKSLYHLRSLLGSLPSGPKRARRVVFLRAEPFLAQKSSVLAEASKTSQRYFDTSWRKGSRIMNISIDPDQHHILSATKDQVILKGHDDTDDMTDCVLFVSRETYLAAIAGWLDRKMEISTSYKGEWCGVGTINFASRLLKKNSHHFSVVVEVEDDGENDGIEIVNVSASSYDAIEFDIDMEHG